MPDTAIRRIAHRRKTEHDVVQLLENDQFGKRSMPGTAGLFSERRLRRWTTARVHFIHRAKNGVYDPFTYFHLVQSLANIAPGQRFGAAAFAAHLNRQVPAFEWDPVTVGRILSDLQDSFSEANPETGSQPIVKTRTYQGALYETTDYPAARAILVALLDDLTNIGGQVYDAQKLGNPWRSLISPLAVCPSIADIARMGLATAV